MNKPIVIDNACFQNAWLSVLKELSLQQWETHNVMVHISDVNSISNELHDRYSEFCARIGIKGSKDVAYTIFPYKYVRKFDTPENLVRHRRAPHVLPRLPLPVSAQAPAAHPRRPRP